MQRFNSALELSLHFHMLVPDGVFVAGNAVDERPRFVKLEGPSDEEVAELLAEVAKRVTKMLHAHGRMLNDECEEEAEPQLLFAGRLAPTSNGPRHEEALPARCARQDGYSLHAGRQVHKNDRVGLEQLARYGLRPALSLERLHEAGDGTYLYEMKRRFSDGRQTLRFAPRELLLRLCALVPPRGFHMVRYHGIFAPHARGRFALTGRGMRDCPAAPLATTERTEPTDARADVPRADGGPPPPPSSASTRARSTAAQPVPLKSAAFGPRDDATRARRLEWSLLMKRSYALDVLCCPRCQGPMRLIAVIDNELVARRILLHLGPPARAPPRVPRFRSGQQRLPVLVAHPTRPRRHLRRCRPASHRDLMIPFALRDDEANLRPRTLQSYLRSQGRGVNTVTISDWERDDRPISSEHDFMLRVFSAMRLPRAVASELGLKVHKEPPPKTVHRLVVAKGTGSRRRP